MLGWSKVICLYNLKYGDIEDVPFDLNHRRILMYDRYALDLVRVESWIDFPAC